jgi:hypothetical protein
MQNITDLNVINLRPTIVISHEGLQAIKHIVAIAPMEAQWFHTVTPIEYKSSPGEIFLQLSDKVYIPKQNTSLAEVDSTGSMMVDFYRELKVDHTQQETNEKLKAMTCWCHSHHTMSPNPSGQDGLQFNSFISLAKDQAQRSWQLMLIFNKKDQFYSRVYDPLTGVIFEGVDIAVVNNYDFTYIDMAAKTKFLKPKLPKLKPGSRLPLKNSLFPENHWYASGNTTALDSKEMNLELAENFIEDIYEEFYKNFTSMSNYNALPVLPEGYTPQELYIEMANLFEPKEMLWLSFLCQDNADKIKNVFTAKQIKAYFKRYPSKAKENICNYLQESKDSLGSLKQKFSTLLKIADCNNSRELSRIF